MEKSGGSITRDVSDMVYLFLQTAINWHLKLVLYIYGQTLAVMAQIP
jgi:hypothetical protein